MAPSSIEIWLEVDVQISKPIQQAHAMQIYARVDCDIGATARVTYPSAWYDLHADDYADTHHTLVA